MAPIEIYPLASSSKGNAYVVRNGESMLLIDNGLPYREFKKRFEESTKRRLDESTNFLAVLLTHSHGDHVSGLPVFLKHHPETVVYANEMTASATAAQEKLGEDVFCCFENGQEFELGPFTVTAFSIPHDTADPVGFLIKVSDSTSTSTSFTYFHGTDIGSPLDSIGLKLKEADVATLESNHDPVMLKTSGRAPCLVQRIAGPRGHLSNDQAADLVRRFASPKLAKLMLAHLSRDCNTPDFAFGTMSAALREMGRGDVELAVLSP